MSWSHQHPSDGMSDGVLSESAQLRSALQAKTYLQALSPDERRRLLKGTKLSGHRRKHHTSAVAAATARRDELQQLLDQDKDRFIDNQTVLAQQPDVSYSSRPAAHETAAWETARLRVRVTSMAAENDALKNHVAQLMRQISNMDRSVQVVSNEARARSQRMTEAAAARIAELEDQVERQQRALSEMSVASEELARDNCAVSDEVVHLREDKASQSQNLEALQDRVAKLQELYMRDLDQSKAVTVHDSIQQSNLLQLATPEMLAMSQPPASFPVPQVAKTAAIVPALHEIETLRRERASLKEQVKSKSDKLARAEEANAEVSALLAAERKAAKLAGAAAQKQLLGSMRRIQYMVSKAKAHEPAQQQKDAYIRKLEARLLNQHKAPGRKLRPGSENSKVATGGVRQRSRETMTVASKQAAEAAVLAQGSSSNSAPATPMFTYHTLSHPLHDASNMPFGHVNSGSSAYQQAPRESAPGQGHWQQGQSSGSCPGQGRWQQGQPSRSSSDCFSMDPAQLEADIATLSSAIAEEAAGLDGGSEGVPSHHGYSAARNLGLVAPSSPSTELHSHFQNEGCDPDGCGMALRGPEIQYPSQYPPYPPQSPSQSPGRSSLQSPPVLTQPQISRHTGQAVEVSVTASSTGVSRKADRHRLDHQDNQEQPSSLEDRHQEEGEGAVGDERPWWHRRQSKEDRLADAAEARLLGLAGRPGCGISTGSGHDPPDWHLRRHQPSSYSRRGMQADNSSSSSALNSQLPRFANQEAAVGSADLHEAPTRGAPTRGASTSGGPAPQVSSGNNARGREMLRAALHNLATHDGSPPSSTSHCSAVSSSPDAATLSAPPTSITANECFDGSALFDSTASASCNAPAESFLHTANGGHQSPPTAEADGRYTGHQKRHSIAKGAGSGDCGNQPAPHQLHASDQHDLRQQQQQPGSGLLHGLPLQMSGQTLGRMSSQILSHVPGQIPNQMERQMPSELTGWPGQQQQAPDSPSRLPSQLAGQLAGTQAGGFSCASWAKPRSLPRAATKLLPKSESSEELMTLEELEHRIASLNTTLMREPSGWQAASVPPDQAAVKKKQSLFDAQEQSTVSRQQRHRQAGVQSNRGEQSSKLGRGANRSTDSTDGLAEEETGMTTWQKLTAKHKVPQGSSDSCLDDGKGQGDLYSSASSPAESIGRLMQAAPLQSPPSTGLRHYSAASKHVSDGWDNDSDTRVLEWAETCSQGASQEQRAPPTGASKGSDTPTTSSQPSRSRPFTMLHNPAAVVTSRHLSPGSAKANQALQAKLSPVAASWRQYDRSNATASSRMPSKASSLSS